MEFVLVKHRTPTGVETVLQYQRHELPEGAEVIETPAAPVGSKVREPKPVKKVETK